MIAAFIFLYNEPASFASSEECVSFKESRHLFAAESHMKNLEALSTVGCRTHIAFVALFALRLFELSLAFLLLAKLIPRVLEDEAQRFSLFEHFLRVSLKLIVNGRSLCETAFAALCGTGNCLALRQSFLDVTLQAVQAEKMVAAIEAPHPRPLIPA